MRVAELSAETPRPAASNSTQVPGLRRAGLAINLAIGSACFVRCSGCYNHFAATEKNGGPISGLEVTSFIDEAMSIDLKQTTFSGGDPLSHPDIFMILEHSKVRGLFVNVDTVGSALLQSAQLRFFGKREVSAVDMPRFVAAVSQVGLPLDGSTNEVQAKFRVGRLALVDETVELARRLHDLGAKININTVLHSMNRSDLHAIAELVVKIAPHKWQIFEFQANGPMAFTNAHMYGLAPGEFDDLIAQLLRNKAHLSATLIEPKSATTRTGIYFKVDDAGFAYRPIENSKERGLIGHITRDRAKVMLALACHFGRMPEAV